MSSFTAFKNPSTFHILSYGTLLGSTVFQSFIGGIVAFRALPRAQFSTLQKSIFPPYFVLQTVTPLALWLTYPRGSSYLFSYLFSRTSSTASAPVSQVPSDSLSAWLIGTMFVTAVVNLVYVGPQTTEVMRLRKHQETRDGKKSWDDGPHSKEMQQLNSRFGILHGISSLVNLIGLGAMIWYGGCLAEFVALD